MLLNIPPDPNQRDTNDQKDYCKYDIHKPESHIRINRMRRGYGDVPSMNVLTATVIVTVKNIAPDN